MDSVQIVFRGMPPSDAVRARIEERAARMKRLDGRATSMHVVVQAANRNHRHGNLFEVRLQARYPGVEIDVGDASQANEDVFAAIADTFDAAERQFDATLRRQDHLRALNGVPVQGRITRLQPQSAYGFIETDAGEEVYFHERNVVNGNFYEFETGDAVLVAFEHRPPDALASELALHATSVRPLTKHHLSDPPSER